MRAVDHPALVVGAGVAGLSSALGLRRATVLTLAPLGAAGSTAWAKGGIAAAIGPHDRPRHHAADTVAVGGGLVDEELAAALAAGGPGAIRRLVDLGARFDLAPDGELALGREAGHSRRRIVHAGGDATGAELSRALAAAVRSAPGVDVLEGAVAVDLARDGDRVTGVVAFHAGGEAVLHRAPAVVLATGGAGGVYARTTNPPDVAGDGLVLAARAGARLADLEFVQFHPTALAADLDPMPLLSEALRGEGAVLVDDEGRRFMADLHPSAELAPRDVVARAIWAVLESGRKAYLDGTGAIGEQFAGRFPAAAEAAAAAGFDPGVDRLPVSPAAHYFMGGIAVDADGRSSLPGLWAVGEVAANGLHGANRLASNSLLEGVVFGRHVARSVRAASAAPPGSAAVPAELPEPGVGDADIIDAVRELMWERVGVVRTRSGLISMLRDLRRLPPASGLRERNLRIVAASIAGAAMARRESRGAHFRADHPAPDPALGRRSFVDPEPVAVGA